jgi:hypothetical protein
MHLCKLQCINSKRYIVSKLHKKNKRLNNDIATTISYDHNTESSKCLRKRIFFLNLTFTIINFIIVEDIDSGVYVLIKTILYNI